MAGETSWGVTDIHLAGTRAVSEAQGLEFVQPEAGAQRAADIVMLSYDDVFGFA